MTSIIVPVVWLLGVALILAAANPTIQTHLDEIYSDFPDVNSPDYAGIFGTNYLDYFMDFAGEVAAKAIAAFALIGAVTVWPTFEIYGQTADPSSHVWMAFIQVVPLAWTGFATWERLPMVGSGG